MGLRFTSAAIASAALICSPLFAASPRPHSAPRAHFTGSGASYMEKYVTALGTPHSIHVRASAEMSQKLAKGKLQHRSMSVEIAWSGPGHYYSRSTGAAGTVMLVNTGSSLFEYFPSRKLAFKEPVSQAGKGFQILEWQVSKMLPLPLPKWDYQGTRSMGGHSCDFLKSHFQGAEESLYLDRSTHMPRRVIVTNSVPAGVTGFDATFDTFDINKPVPASFFRFTPPPGVKVTTPPPPPTAGRPGQPMPRR